MKKKFLFLLAAFALQNLQAQPTGIQSNTPNGADPAAVSIQFLPGDATGDPKTGIVTIYVPVKATVKNIGTKPYLPGNEALVMYLYQIVDGKDVPIEHKAVNILQAGMSVELQHVSSYIKGKQEPPTFKLAVLSKSAGVPNPDVNMPNNRKVAQAPK